MHRRGRIHELEISGRRLRLRLRIRLECGKRREHFRRGKFRLIRRQMERRGVYGFAFQIPIASSDVTEWFLRLSGICIERLRVRFRG